MVITVESELEAVLREQARRQGISPEMLAVQTLKNQFLKAAALEARDDWERQLRAVATDCGVALTDAALGREGLYD